MALRDHSTSEGSGQPEAARRLFGKPIGLGLIIIEKCLAALFFGAGAVILLALYQNHVTDPIRSARSRLVAWRSR